MLNRAATFLSFASLSINHGTYMLTMKAEKNTVEFSICHFHHSSLRDDKASDNRRHYSSTSNYAMLCIHCYAFMHFPSKIQKYSKLNTHVWILIETIAACISNFFNNINLRHWLSSRCNGEDKSSNFWTSWKPII